MLDVGRLDVPECPPLIEVTNVMSAVATIGLFTGSVLAIAIALPMGPQSTPEPIPGIAGTACNAAPECSGEPALGLDWNLCGFIPFAGYEGWANQHGRIWCDEGEAVCLIEDQFTSSNAAREELTSVLAGNPTQGRRLPVRHVAELGTAFVVELAEPIPVTSSRDTRFSWVVLWAEGASIHYAYGCSREMSVRLHEKGKGPDATGGRVRATAPN